MKEEEMNLENIKSKIKKFKWINRIQIIIMILLFLLRLSNPNKNIASILITILAIITPICIIAISILHNKIYKLELTANKLTSDKMRMKNILNDVELMKEIKQQLKDEEEHKN